MEISLIIIITIILTIHNVTATSTDNVILVYSTINNNIVSKNENRTEKIVRENMNSEVHVVYPQQDNSSFLKSYNSISTESSGDLFKDKDGGYERSSQPQFTTDVFYTTTQMSFENETEAFIGNDINSQLESETEAYQENGNEPINISIFPDVDENYEISTNSYDFNNGTTFVNDEDITTNNPMVIPRSTSTIKVSTESTLTTTNLNKSLNETDTDFKRGEYKENEIEIQSSDKHTTTLISPNKSKWRKELKSKHLHRTFENSIKNKQNSVANSIEKPTYKLANMTNLIRDRLKKTQTPSLTNRRDSILRESIKSKKFISALMERNKNRNTTKLFKVSDPKISANTTKFGSPKTTNKTSLRRTYVPKIKTITTRNITTRIITTTLTDQITTSSPKDNSTFKSDEILVNDLATEWSSMKIKVEKNDSLKLPYRGAKRFSITDVVKVLPLNRFEKQKF